MHRSVSWDDAPYEGGLSTLTRFGTMNVSTARIPKKRRSRGNVPAPRTNCRGYAPTSEGVALAEQGIASVKVTYADGTTETRSANSFRKTSERARGKKAPQVSKQSDLQKYAHIIGTIGNEYD